MFQKNVRVFRSYIWITSTLKKKKQKASHIYNILADAQENWTAMAYQSCGSQRPGTVTLKTGFDPRVT